MLLPTDLEIKTAKADALARFGRDEVLLVQMGAPIDFAVLVAPLDLAGYCAFADQQIEDLDTAQRNLLHARLVWPFNVGPEGDRRTDAVSDRLSKRPAMAARVAGRLVKRAGRREGEPNVEPLDDVLARGAAEVIPGLSADACRKLLADNASRELWAVTSPGLSLVMSTPEGDVWSLARTREVDALKSKKGIVQSTLDIAKQAIVWSQVNVDMLLDNLPALSADISSAYKTMGGDAAEVTSKSL